MSNLFNKKPTKGEKTRWFIYDLLSGCLGCFIPILLFPLVVVGLVFWIIS